ncbi:DUF4352 domain-containing protein [Enterococcus lactis]|uniref:DUF4352 domain-containing protein n=1 Tax=Enterococcus lactis TaxID=357441 RepID=UPI0040426FCF
MLKKMCSAIVAGLLVILLVGCSTSHLSKKTSSSSRLENTIKEKKAKKNNNNTQYVRGLELTIGETTVTNKGGDTKNNIVSIEMNVKNTNNMEVGFGSNDFYIKIGDKKIDPYAKGVNFGEKLGKGKKFSGTMTFEIPKKTDKIILVYGTNDTASWNITL